MQICWLSLSEGTLTLLALTEAIEDTSEFETAEADASF